MPDIDQEQIKLLRDAFIIESELLYKIATTRAFHGFLRKMKSGEISSDEVEALLKDQASVVDAVNFQVDKILHELGRRAAARGHKQPEPEFVGRQLETMLSTSLSDLQKSVDKVSDASDVMGVKLDGLNIVSGIIYEQSKRAVKNTSKQTAVFTGVVVAVAIGMPISILSNYLYERYKPSITEVLDGAIQGFETSYPDPAPRVQEGAGLRQSCPEPVMSERPAKNMTRWRRCNR